VKRRGRGESSQLLFLVGFFARKITSTIITSLKTPPIKIPQINNPINRSGLVFYTEILRTLWLLKGHFISKKNGFGGNSRVIITLKT